MSTAREPKLEAAKDNDLVSRPGQDGPIPVLKDEVPIEDPIDETGADSDETLERDEKEAIDEDNIVDGRTRGAIKEKGAYREPGDEEGLPVADDGTSAVRTAKVSEL